MYFLPGGALAVPHGDQIVTVANRLAPRYELVVATMDWHAAHHKSFASQHPGRKVGDVIQWKGLEQILWLDHCIQDTPGAELCAGLARSAIHQVVRKGTDPDIDSYSGFFDNGRHNATELADLLRERGADELDVMGLATDYCVRFTELDAAELGFKTALILAGCRGVDLEAGDSARAVESMRQAGVTILTHVPSQVSDR